MLKKVCIFLLILFTLFTMHSYLLSQYRQPPFTKKCHARSTCDGDEQDYCWAYGYASGEGKVECDCSVWNEGSFDYWEIECDGAWTDMGESLPYYNSKNCSLGENSGCAAWIEDWPPDP